jgi:hypothetical protein
MAKTVEVDLQVNSNLQGSIAELKALKRELRNTAAGSEEFKQIFNQIDDLEDKIKSSRAASSDWIDTLESAGGPIGELGGAINKAKVATQTFGGALKATGIGLLVSLVGGLVSAFNNSSDATKKLQPLLIGLEKIFNGVFAIVEPLFNTMVELAIKALPMVSKAFAVVYSSVAAVVQSLGSLGQAVYKFVTGDFAGAWESAKSSVTDFSKNYNESIARFEEGTKRLTKTEKENADIRIDTKKKEIEKVRDLNAEQFRNAQEEYENYLKSINDLQQRYFDEQQDMLANNDQKALNLWFERRAKEIEEITKDENLKTDLYLQLNQLRADKQAKIDQASFETRKDLQLKYVDVVNSAGRLLQQAAGNNKDLAIAGIILEQASAVASIAINTQKNAAKSGYFSPTGIAELAAGAVGIASAIMSARQGIQAINSSGIQGGSGGGGGGMSAPPAPRFNVVGASGINQVAEGISRQNNQPIKAYVVSKDVTTAQSMDRNIIGSASM